MPGPPNTNLEFVELVFLQAMPSWSPTRDIKSLKIVLIHCLVFCIISIILTRDI